MRSPVSNVFGNTKRHSSYLTPNHASGRLALDVLQNRQDAVMAKIKSPTHLRTLMNNTDPQTRAKDYHQKLIKQQNLEQKLSLLEQLRKKAKDEMSISM
jgi:hypothetical protein